MDYIRVCYVSGIVVLLFSCSASNYVSMRSDEFILDYNMSLNGYYYDSLLTKEYYNELVNDTLGGELKYRYIILFNDGSSQFDPAGYFSSIDKIEEYFQTFYAENLKYHAGSGYFTVNKDTIFVKMLNADGYGFFWEKKYYTEYRGLIKNDTTFILAEKRDNLSGYWGPYEKLREEQVFHFKQFSPKPDSSVWFKEKYLMPRK